MQSLLGLESQKQSGRQDMKKNIQNEMLTNKFEERKECHRWKM